jgi:D-alanyl-D-alanine carboxypeptidase (penicillin-binding protein 5/6)
MEAIDSGRVGYDDPVTIAADSSRVEGTRLFLEVGEVRTVKELLYGVAVESANDAANALAAHLGGTIPNFVQMMNARAKELGCVSTSFVTANGLHSDEHYSSARDMAIMSTALLQHPDILEFTDTWMIDVYVGKNSDIKRTLANTNKLLTAADYIDGLKTGYTSQSGHCVTATGKIGDLRLVAVVMASEDSQARFDEAKALLDFGFGQYEARFPVREGERVATLSPFRSGGAEVEIVAATDAYELALKGDEAEYSVKTTLFSGSASAPLKKGEVVGEVVVARNGEIMATIDAVCAEDVPKSGFAEYVRDTLDLFL